MKGPGQGGEEGTSAYRGCIGGGKRGGKTSVRGYGPIEGARGGSEECTSRVFRKRGRLRGREEGRRGGEEGARDDGRRVVRSEGRRGGGEKEVLGGRGGGGEGGGEKEVLGGRGGGEG